MLLLATIAILWAAVCVLAVGLCLAAKRGDQAQVGQFEFVATATTGGEVSPVFFVDMAAEPALSR